MNDPSTLAQNALWLSIALSLPIVGIAALASLVMALFQAMTQIQDITIAHLPRFVAVVVSLALLGPWMGRHLASFARLAFGGG